MYKKKPFFIVFEGVEGCGKSYQSHKLKKKLQKKKIKVLLTREPGGTRGAESISCLLYTSPSPRDGLLSRMPSSA